MDLLTVARLSCATEDELVHVLRIVCERLRELNEARALQAAREVLVEHECRPALRLAIGVDEWDDGYFYAGVQSVEDTSGRPISLSPGALTALDSALQEPLTELVYAGDPLGRSATVTLDLADGTVAY